VKRAGVTVRFPSGLPDLFTLTEAASKVAGLVDAGPEPGDPTRMDRDDSISGDPTQHGGEHEPLRQGQSQEPLHHDFASRAQIS
jgi:hypothetical protein